jgi:hypothetical protein
MKEKRAVLDGVAAELRRITGKPAETASRRLTFQPDPSVGRANTLKRAIWPLVRLFAQPDHVYGWCIFCASGMTDT